MLCVRLTVTSVRLNALHYFFLISALGKYSRRRNFSTDAHFLQFPRVSAYKRVDCICIIKHTYYSVTYRSKFSQGIFPIEKLIFYRTYSRSTVHIRLYFVQKLSQYASVQKKGLPTSLPCTDPVCSFDGHVIWLYFWLWRVISCFSITLCRMASKTKEQFLN